ncbi:PREDICTED: uncharacterized protein LOC105368690 [Ceratosolen solmsi marchali]|uniref:Uncharacterized protein LOC105368690 n=1 Tax=Ceratosolen solmsi marchali TaxID=326594 RepID=A0AAJ6YX98_9HYME|nr:PREDICTED: uncharacterized protein LOC105368690 [Ceratosolen solmsi marchali]
MVDNNCIIEGNVKFRDGKKWKSRWCVMRKLSPVADCLHLQLYGDSKDRYKQGQTKASLSLQHFLGVQSAFTLDKESNTIAIICQDVTVVLAFDTRERLIQWQVKISNNLGEDQQFLILISSAPVRAKLSTGPAHLHVQEHRFCMTVGVPPRLIGTWEIGQLRRYGVVEGRFCFEGGSRCGRGEGLHVLISDQGDEIVRALQLAAEGKLSTRKRSLPALSCQESPRRQVSRSDTRASDLLHQFDERCDGGFKTDGSSSYWSSTESRQEAESEDSRSLVSELAEQGGVAADWRSCSLSRQHGTAACLERCSSCIGKLGAMSKSSTGSNNLGQLGYLGHLQPRAADRISLSSYSGSSQDGSDYSGIGQPGECRCSPQPQSQSQSQPQAQSQSQSQAQSQQPPLQPTPQQKATPAVGPRRHSPSPLALPPRPPKPSQAGPRKAKKPPMPLPADFPQLCSCTRKPAPSPPRNGGAIYENYDIPKTILAHHISLAQSQQPLADQYYDTPRKIKEFLGLPKAYPNYDTPHVPQAVVLQQCGCPAKLTPQAPKSLACPCHNVMSWAGFVLPYCRRGAGIEPTGISVKPIRLSGEGKMPVVNASGQLAIYNSTRNDASVESSQSLGNAGACPIHQPQESVKGGNYENVEPVIDTQPEAKSGNYANIDFTTSLGNYENSKELLSKVGLHSGGMAREAGRELAKGEVEEEARVEDEHRNGDVDKGDTLVCQKCGHLKKASENYLVVDEDNEGPRKPIPGYLPMQPAHNACSKEVLSRLCSGIKSSSNPALSGLSPLEIGRKRSESEYRVPGSAMLSSPYFRRRLLEMSSSEAGGSLGMLLRKRSYSVESAHYLDDEKDTFTPNVPIHKCPSDTDKALVSNELLADSETETNGSPGALSLSPQPLSSIKIRRSSSVPSKAGHNRDSSSSNDSGVSTGSLSHRTAEFVEFEFPTAPTNTLVKKQSIALMYRKSPPPACFHNSLPRKSKSSDPLRELTFQFHRTKLPTKSSSAEADIPTCLPTKGSKEFNSPGEVTNVPYIDSRSTSSGTSDMSDYIETLSLSSHSSSDAPDNLRISGRAVTTTLRPRSGKEYYKIDRSILVEQGRTISSSSNYANVTPFVRKETHRHPIT